MPRHSFKIYPNILVVFQGIAGVSIWLFAASYSIGQLDSLDRSTLEEFGDIPIVLSSKNPTQLFEAPVGSFVFDEAAIDTLPIDSLAEMLRYAPGVHIIRPSNGIWGVGMRGINSRFFYRVGFIDFARWESDSTSNPTTIAVLSDQDLHGELRRIARDQLSSRKLEIIHLKPGTQPPSRESTFSLSRRVKTTISKRLKDIAWKRGFC